MSDSFGGYAGALSKRPPGMGELSGRVFDLLAAYTAFPWPVLETQAKRAKKDPMRLQPSDLVELVPRLIEAVGRFAAPDKTAQAQAELRALLATAAP